MKDKIITEIQNQMARTLSSAQLDELQSVLKCVLRNVGITEKTADIADSKTNAELLTNFISAKRIVGCS
jgi:hypothetical protein